MQNIFSFFLLILLLHRIRSESENEPDQEEEITSVELKNDVDTTLNVSTTTKATVTVDSKDSESHKVINFVVNKIKHEEQINSLDGTVALRSSRYVSREALQCVSCFGSGSSDKDCYSGTSSKIENCAEIEACFTEIHPQYIKRGCMVALGVNRTFVCKCHLCNDKPATDITYYDYKTINDWKYDNERLEKPVLSTDLFCKSCETTGRNVAADNICRNGSKVDNVLCGHQQLCYTNIDHLTDFVSRGCIDTPIYNSMLFFCNFTYCNRKAYENPVKPKSSLAYRSNEVAQVKAKVVSATTTATANGYLLAGSTFSMMRQVEGDSDDLKIIKELDSDTSQANLVSFLVNNLKEVFDDNNDDTEFLITSTTTVIPTTTIKTIIYTIEEDPKLTDDVIGYTNMSYNTLIDSNSLVSSDNEPYMTKKHSLKLILQQKKDSMRKYEQKLVKNSLTTINPSTVDSTSIQDSNEAGRERSCIFCNNVKFEDCSDPKNKLIPSIVCEHESDICYSQHTPFGIIDRGCFNINRNLTTYVCSCNLCNHIPIYEMPYVFLKKKDWFHNVVELSRTRNFRKSVFKDMACLQCEVNSTDMKGNINDSANCLEGKVDVLPTQVCGENEVCAIKVIKSDGYIWRGCTRTPLYNYWWTFCDTDLCNYDSLVSLFDYL